jgi:hypothetical protein
MPFFFGNIACWDVSFFCEKFLLYCPLLKIGLVSFISPVSLRCALRKGEGAFFLENMRLSFLE